MDFRSPCVWLSIRFDFVVIGIKFNEDHFERGSSHPFWDRIQASPLRRSIIDGDLWLSHEADGWGTEFGSAIQLPKSEISEFRGTDVVNSSGEVLEINWVWGKDQIPFFGKSCGPVSCFGPSSLWCFWNMLGDGQQKTDFWNVNEFNNSSRSDQEPQKK